MTGAELKQFIKDRGWTVDQAAIEFGVGRATLFDQFNRPCVSKLYQLACESLARKATPQNNNL